MNWTRGHIIGHGSSAGVSIAVSRPSGHVFAVKSTEFSQSEFLQKEQKIMSTLNSPHIVTYKGYDITRENNKLMFNLMMEYIPGGTLADAIQKQGSARIHESMIAYYTSQILQGLEYLHSSGVVHCDIKGCNILLAENGVKIADFGCSRRLDADEQEISTAGIGGTPMFMAPEVARGDEQSFPSDIWSLGCTIIEMATGGSPWNNSTTTPESLLYHIAFSDQIPEFPGFLSDQAKDFLSKCLKRNPRQRWTAKQLLKHQFLNEIISNFKHNQEFDNSTSPTSILDHGIWNSIEESSSSSEIVPTSSSNSPIQRVKTLCSKSSKSMWTWDETWITSRSNEDQENAVKDSTILGNVCCNDSYCGGNSMMSSTFMEDRVVVNDNIIFERQKRTINKFQFL